MSRPRVCKAPMAVASDGTIIVNAYQLATKNDLAAVVECAKKSGLDLLIGIVVPPRLRGPVLHDADDALADLVGRLGPELLKRRRRRQ